VTAAGKHAKPLLLPAEAIDPRYRRALAGRPILVTGATGFVGRHLVGTLAACGAEPWAVVRPGREGAVAAGVRTIVWDLTEGRPARLLPRELAAVVHLAAPRDRWSAALTTYGQHVRLAIEAAAQLYAAAQDRGARQVIAASTIAAVGPASRILTHDRAAPFDSVPAHPYALTKRWSEDLAMHARAYTRYVTIVRPGPIYGPGQSAFGYLQTLVKRLRRGESIPLAPPRGRIIAPVYILDVVYVLVASLARPGNDTLTIGGPDARRERTLVDDLAGWLGLRPRISVDRRTRPDNFATDHTVIDRLFPERPRTAWKQGMRLTWSQ
jgi:nucleoside-diphosphate-sugar epimerase